MEECPAGEWTFTLTLPTACDGLVVVISVSEKIWKVAAKPPNVTDVAPVKWLPVMVTAVPPAAGPLVGVRVVTTGAAVEPAIPGGEVDGAVVVVDPHPARTSSPAVAPMILKHLTRYPLYQFAVNNDQAARVRSRATSGPPHKGVAGDERVLSHVGSAPHWRDCRPGQ